MSTEIWKPVQITDRWTPWNITSGTENVVLQALQFQDIGICSKFSGVANISNWRPNELWRVN
jgi:hypothetical protein